MVAPLLRGGGGQCRSRGDDALDRARDFDRSEDRVDAAIDQRERRADLDKRIYRRTGDQCCNRADAENDDKEPRSDAAGSCQAVRQAYSLPCARSDASLRAAIVAENRAGYNLSYI